MLTFYRRLPRFEYRSPDRIEDVLVLITGKGANGFKLYAGGTDVIPKLKKRLIAVPEILIDLKGIKGLDYIEYDLKKGLRIGALASVRSVAASGVVSEHFPILSEAAGSIAAWHIQNRATIVGNICNAVPSADSAPALLTLEASVLCVNANGERVVPIGEFFTGPNETILKDDEMVKEIQIPNLPLGSGGKYIKLSTRKKMDLAVVGVAVVIVSREGICKELRIGLGAVAPTPIRARKAEKILLGQNLTDELIEQCSQVAADESKPIDDHRASAHYRKAMVSVLVKRAIHQAVGLENHKRPLV
jgi:CO/xanthine dehydrogenase FAD-binding subunit